MNLIKELFQNNNVPVILAPMSGVTDLPYRDVVARFGSDLLVSEMVSSRSMNQQNTKSMQKSSCRSDILTAVQLVGCDPEDMAQAAILNEQLGAKIIDINFGCPVKKVIKGYAGSYLMKDEKLASSIIKKVVNAVNIPVTIKMRMGWDENSLNAPNIAKIAEDLGASMLSVHCRTRAQMYSGKARWNFIQNVRERVQLPIIVNGDINTPEDALLALSQSGADGVMVGRGSYGKPWVLQQISDVINNKCIISDLIHMNFSAKINIITSHFNSIIDYYGNDLGVKIARKHLSWYSAGMQNSNRFRSKINNCTDLLEIKDFISRFFSDNPDNLFI